MQTNDLGLRNFSSILLLFSLADQITENDILTGTTTKYYIQESPTTPSTRSTNFQPYNGTSTVNTFQSTMPETPSSDSDLCPPLKEDMDNLTQEQFTKILTHECRYDKVVRPGMNDRPLTVSVQIDLKHIEAVEQLVSVFNTVPVDSLP